MDMLTTDEQNLLIELRQSNIENPVRHLYQLYFEVIIAHVCSNGGDREDGEDIFQEAVLALIEKVKTGQFRGDSSIKTFLMGIARNLWLFELRTRKRRNNREELYMNNADKEPETIGSFFDKTNTNGLQQVLNEIGETCKKILIGFYYENKSMKELLLQINYENEQVLRNRKSKCMKKLKNILSSNSNLLNTLKQLSLYGQ